MFYILFDIVTLSCLSLRILWAPWDHDPGARSDGQIGRDSLILGFEPNQPAYSAIWSYNVSASEIKFEPAYNAIWSYSVSQESKFF